MKSETIIFNQPAGIGDIFFLQHAAEMFYNKGYNIVWPVEDNIMPITYNIISKANFIPKSLFQNTSNFKTINFHIADQLVKYESVMQAKYDLINKSSESSNWIESFALRNWYNDEMFDKFNLRNDDGSIKPYIIISDYVGTPPTHVRRPVEIESDDIIIRVDVESGYSLFDWLTLFFKAKQIHLVETCYVYLIEYIFKNIKKPDNFFNLYSKHYPATYIHVNMIMKLNWNLNYWDKDGKFI
jgi:hypothetical protein